MLPHTINPALFYSCNCHYSWWTGRSIRECFRRPWLAPRGIVGKSPQRPCNLSNHLLSGQNICINVTSNSWCNQWCPKSLWCAWRGPSSASGGYRMVQRGAETPVVFIPPVWPAAQRSGRTQMSEWQWLPEPCARPNCLGVGIAGVVSLVQVMKCVSIKMQ